MAVCVVIIETRITGGEAIMENEESGLQHKTDPKEPPEGAVYYEDASGRNWLFPSVSQLAWSGSIQRSRNTPGY